MDKNIIFGGSKEKLSYKKIKKKFLNSVRIFFVFCTIIKWFISMRKNWSVFIYSVEFGIKNKD